MRYLLIIAVFLHTQLIGAQIDLTYYLPDIKYEETITTPQDFFGHQIGEWHLSHDKLSLYVQQLAKESPRVKYIEYARSHEYRPLAYLLISSVKNQARISEIQTEHLALSNPSTSASLNISKMPAVIYQGYNVHGNESSGGNAAALIAYYLAAAKGREVERLLDNTVILLDPCMNPDGFHRFSTWVNMHKNKHLTADPQDREYAEAWPGGRTNHYWFDLNRDWLPVQHPESRGRIRVFHEWKPNILTDHHEMSSNFTFFFQPGVPQRTNPITPDTNQVLTEKIGNYHAAALDEIGSLYFSKERYDDFYYGKGSTYPDANACIGILFEQGSSRGHLQETDNGILSFPFTIRNQVVTSFSTQQAALDLREELLNYQRDFHQTALSEAKRSPIKGYVFSEKNDKTRLNGLLHILLQHQIDVYKATNALSANGERFPKENTYIVPMQQTQHRLVRAMFETNTTFQDSLFYDVSTWTLPLAFNLDYAPLKGNVSLGKKITAEDLTNEGTTPDFSRYAYLMEWEEYFAPTALYQIMKRGLRAKVASSEFQLNQRKFKAGTILIPVQNQPMQAEEIYALLEKLAQTKGVNIYDMDTGLTAYGIDLGSSDFELLEKPSVLLLVGEGVTSYDAGEVWHQLDQRYEIPVSMLETTKLARADLSRYNVIILPSGSYQAVSGMGIQKLREWSMKGGTIIGIKNAVRWLSNKSLARIDFQAQERKSVGRRPYDKIQEDRGSYLIGGAIFEAMIDQTHPLFYGYSQRTLPTFRKGTLFFKPTENQYAMPSIYSPSPLLSGYVNAQMLSKNSSTGNTHPNIIVAGIGRGKTICLADNPVFRGFWWGTNKILANAIFFGASISNNSVNR